MAEANIVGHFDFFSRYAPERDSKMHYSHAPEAFDRLFRIMVKNGQALEINVGTVNSLMKRKGYSLKEAMPDAAILNRFRELGGRSFTICSDAHHEDQNGLHMKETMDYLKILGIDSFVWFEAGEEKKIEDVVIAENSNIALNKLNLKSSGYPVYGADGIIGYIDDFQQIDKYISIVKDGAGVGRLNLCENQSSLLGTLTYLKSRNLKSYDLTWIYYLLNTVDFFTFVKGSGIPHIYYSDYKNKNIVVPNLSEQQKIASCFSSLDEIIEAQTEAIEQLKLHKKGLMQGLFPKISD